MPRPVQVAVHPPAEVEETLRRWGGNIRTARLRRNWRQDDLARRLGVSRALVAQLERGSPRTAVAVYVGALWAMGLLAGLVDVGAPDADAEGRALERARHPQRASRSRPGSLSDEF